MLSLVLALSMTFALSGCGSGEEKEKAALAELITMMESYSK